MSSTMLIVFGLPPPRIHILGQKRGVHVTTEQEDLPVAAGISAGCAIESTAWTVHQSVVSASGLAGPSTQLTSLSI
jgi:hypothetical protein